MPFFKDWTNECLPSFVSFNYLRIHLAQVLANLQHICQHCQGWSERVQAHFGQQRYCVGHYGHAKNGLVQETPDKILDNLKDVMSLENKATQQREVELVNR